MDGEGIMIVMSQEYEGGGSVIELALLTLLLSDCLKVCFHWRASGGTLMVVTDSISSYWRSIEDVVMDGRSNGTAISFHVESTATRNQNYNYDDNKKDYPVTTVSCNSYDTGKNDFDIPNKPYITIRTTIELSMNFTAHTVIITSV